MAYWNEPLSTVGLITLVMSVGFSVDLVAHTALAYVETPVGVTSQATTTHQQRQKRALFSMAKVGKPVLLSGASTQVAIFPSVFSLSPIFRSFFRIMSLVIGLGLLHGLVFLPSFLSWVGPTTRAVPPEEVSGSDTTDSTDNSESQSSFGSVTTTTRTQTELDAPSMPTEAEGPGRKM
ncbi:MAG: hypothetical protein MHM6MM_001122 [Cercozoa sp. M6MM]